MDGFVTAQEAAKLIGVSKRRVIAMVAAGQLPAQSIGTQGMLLIARADLKLVKNRKPGRPKGSTKHASK